MKVFCLNKISEKALAGLKSPDKTVDNIDECDAILVRSADMRGQTLGENVLAVARAGAGVNNIPVFEYAQKGIVVFNTPGANANAVKELVLCSLFLSSRDVIGGNRWVCANAGDGDISVSAEKAKSGFAGTEIKGKTLAVIGLGVIGVQVADAAVKLGMRVNGYDPYLSIANAVQLDKSVNYCEKLYDAVREADYISVHVPATENTKGLINAELIGVCEKSIILINFSRDVIVDEEYLGIALKAGKVKKYVTDFANAKVVNYNNVIVLPHLGASTEEAEDNCAEMAIEELKDYIENGNITHSVNYPDLNAGRKESLVRLAVCHRNIPGIIANFSTAIYKCGGNIANLANKSRGEYAYSVIDIESEIDVSEIEKMEGVLRVRRI